MQKVLLALFLVFLVGCSSAPIKQHSEISCQQDSDCACGKHITTGDCFYGNKAYVNTNEQCPDFCTGIAGNFVTKCVAGICKQVNTLIK